MNNLEESVARPNKLSSHLGWIAFGVLCLVFFTFIKLPDDRIKANIDQMIRSAFADRGIEYSATESQLSLLFGPSYTIQNISLSARGQTAQGHIDRIKISPSLLPLIVGRYGGSIELTQAGGSLEGSFSMSRSKISASFQFKKLDLGKLGLLPLLANLQGAALLEGSANISGDVSIPSTLEGKVALRMKQIHLDSQAVMGFSIPQIHISEAMVHIQLEKAKALIQTFRVGQSNGALAANPDDDLQALITGEAALGKDWYSSTLNVKARFAIAEGILRAFILLDAILGTAKQSDGSYAYQLAGSFMSPVPTPIGGNF
jgi:type II secretion system protein N